MKQPTCIASVQYSLSPTGKNQHYANEAEQGPGNLGCYQQILLMQIHSAT
jgi:hypothetical protein